MGSRALREAIGRFRRQPKGQGIDLSPDTPFDALMELRIRELDKQVGELKGRLNALIFTVLGALIVQVLLGIMI